MKMRLHPCSTVHGNLVAAQRYEELPLRTSEAPSGQPSVTDDGLITSSLKPVIQIQSTGSWRHLEKLKKLLELAGYSSSTDDPYLLFGGMQLRCSFGSVEQADRFCGLIAAPAVPWDATREELNQDTTPYPGLTDPRWAPDMVSSQERNSRHLFMGTTPSGRNSDVREVIRRLRLCPVARPRLTDEWLLKSYDQDWKLQDYVPVVLPSIPGSLLMLAGLLEVLSLGDAMDFTQFAEVKEMCFMVLYPKSSSCGSHDIIRPEDPASTGTRAHWWPPETHLRSRHLQVARPSELLGGQRWECIPRIDRPRSVLQTDQAPSRILYDPSANSHRETTEYSLDRQAEVSAPCKQNITRITSAFNLIDIDKIRRGLDVRTTIMLRNIPNKVEQSMLKQFLDETSFGKYDFLYLRIDFTNNSNVGYGFVNFTDPGSIIDFVSYRVGRLWGFFGSSKRVEVSYAAVQGQDCLVQKFRNSSVMLEHPSFRPLIFHSTMGRLQGHLQPFPEPDNDSKMRRSVANAGQIGLFSPRHPRDSGGDRLRSRRSQFDRGTRMAWLEEGRLASPRALMTDSQMLSPPSSQQSSLGSVESPLTPSRPGSSTLSMRPQPENFPIPCNFLSQNVVPPSAPFLELFADHRAPDTGKRLELPDHRQSGKMQTVHEAKRPRDHCCSNAALDPFLLGSR